MKSLFSSRELSDATRHRIELAIAVAQERLISTHVQHALRFLQVVGDSLSPVGALNIYARVMRLPGDDARGITTRALAALGEQVVRGEEIAETPDEETEAEGDRRFSLLRFVRERLRGRVKEELREWVELAGARAEMAILQTHVENARTFVELLEKELPAPEAAEMYLDRLDVRDSIAEVVYYSVLARLLEERRTSRSTSAGTIADARITGETEQSPEQ